MRRAVLEVFRERGIEIPLPQRTLSADPDLAAILKGRG
jgi:small-conductance mechanosensitive channel